jgi:hypothetical protein
MLRHTVLKHAITHEFDHVSAVEAPNATRIARHSRVNSSSITNRALRVPPNILTKPSTPSYLSLDFSAASRGRL